MALELAPEFPEEHPAAQPPSPRPRYGKPVTGGAEQGSSAGGPSSEPAAGGKTTQGLWQQTIKGAVQQNRQLNKQFSYKISRDFSDTVSARLRDYAGDKEKLTPQQISQMVEDLEAEEKGKKSYKRLFLVVAVICALLITAIVGLTYGTFQDACAA